MKKSLKLISMSDYHGFKKVFSQFKRSAAILLDKGF